MKADFPFFARNLPTKLCFPMLSAGLFLENDSDLNSLE